MEDQASYRNQLTDDEKLMEDSWRDVLTNAKRITSIIDQINAEVEKLPEASMEKANTIVNYDKEIAKTILKLRNGAIDKFEGEEIKSLPANLIPLIAKGICYHESFDREMGEAIYKSVNTKIEALKANLNGFQSIIRVLQ